MHMPDTLLRLLAMAPVALAVLLAGCATAEPAVPDEPAAGTGRPMTAPLNIGGADHDAHWFLPDGPAVALVTLQHGFTRSCANLRGTLVRLAGDGLMGLCIDASMARGNPALARALAQTLLSGVTAPDGRALPEKIIVGGHSSGAHFAAHLGAQLDRSAPHRLAGALLFEPVAASSGFGSDLLVLSAAGQRPVRVVSASAGGCNAQHNAYPALHRMQQQARRAGGDGFVGLQLNHRSTHMDVEGADTNLLAVLACRQGRPQPGNVEALRRLATGWALDMAAGTRRHGAYPGGPYVEGLLAAGDARVIAAD